MVTWEKIFRMILGLFVVFGWLTLRPRTIRITQLHNCFVGLFAPLSKLNFDEQ